MGPKTEHGRENEERKDRKTQRANCHAVVVLTKVTELAQGNGARMAAQTNRSWFAEKNAWELACRCCAGSFPPLLTSFCRHNCNLIGGKTDSFRYVSLKGWFSCDLLCAAQHRKHAAT